jgi:hypothetical protein
MESASDEPHMVSGLPIVNGSGAIAVASFSAGGGKAGPGSAFSRESGRIVMPALSRHPPFFTQK